MGKSDDSISRRKNKKKLKKQDSKSQVSNRIASIIAAKKRRLTGKRRMCQGMCFSLPTLEDPFNDRNGKAEPTRKRKRDSKENKKSLDKKGVTKRGKRNLAFISSFSFMGPEIVIDLGKRTCKIFKTDGSTHSWKQFGLINNSGCPSKYLTICLNSIQNNMQRDGDLSCSGKKSLIANAWGLEFWNCYTSGKDVLETDVADSSTEHVSWIVSTAADTISTKEKEGISFSGPFLLYLVPSQDKAHEVRKVCKPLKTLGIHAVSLHSGASIDHQINGLKSCEPEFLISTPGRLLELLALKAVDISGIALLVIDGLEAPFKDTYFDEVKKIRQSISGDLRTVVFSVTA